MAAHSYLWGWWAHVDKSELLQMNTYWTKRCSEVSCSQNDAVNWSSSFIRLVKAVKQKKTHFPPTDAATEVMFWSSISDKTVPLRSYTHVDVLHTHTYAMAGKRWLNMEFSNNVGGEILSFLAPFIWWGRMLIPDQNQTLNQNQTKNQSH